MFFVKSIGGASLLSICIRRRFYPEKKPAPKGAGEKTQLISAEMSCDSGLFSAFFNVAI